MLFMGIKTSFTKNPIKPMTANPTAQAPAIRTYSVYYIPFLSGLLHLLSNLLLSCANSLISLIVELTKFCFSDIFLLISHVCDYFKDKITLFLS